MVNVYSNLRADVPQAGMLTRALDTRVAEAAQLRKALEVAKREAARMHAEMDELRQVGSARQIFCLLPSIVTASNPSRTCWTSRRRHSVCAELLLASLT